MIEIGTQIGEYRIDGSLGEGGMAEVYRAWQPNLQRYEALKVLLPHMAHDQLLVERFLSEARTVANLQHPNIAAVYTISSAGAPRPFFTMELVEGKDLAKLIRARGQLPLEEALPILRQIAAALDYAHNKAYVDAQGVQRKGIVHRDIKPANVLLEQGTNGFVAKVVDFGISKALDDSNNAHLTRTGTFIGTPEYMSPEQAGSGDVVDQRTDQYSLAIVAYEMLCGVPPFRQEGDTTMMSVLMKHVREQPLPPSRYNQNLPASVDAAILRALAKHPAQRFSSCEEFVNALTTYQAPSAPPLPEHRKSTFPSAAVAVILTVVIGAALIIVGVLSGNPDSPNNNSEVSSIAQRPINNTESPPSPPQVTVPYVVGQTEAEARSALGNNSLAVTKLEGHSNTFSAGQVMSQYPAGGKDVEQGAVVTIRVSLGVDPQSSFVLPTDADINEVRNDFDLWQVAWRSEDIGQFMNFYSPGIIQKRANKPAFGYNVMRQRLVNTWNQVSNIAITSGDPMISVSGNRIILTTNQSYADSRYWDVGVKRLVWAKENGRWVIIEESFQKRAGGAK